MHALAGVRYRSWIEFLDKISQWREVGDATSGARIQAQATIRYFDPLRSTKCNSFRAREEL